MEEWFRFIRTFMGPTFGQPVDARREVTNIGSLCEAISMEPSRGWDIIRLVDNILRNNKGDKGPTNAFKEVQRSFTGSERDFAFLVFGILFTNCTFTAKDLNAVILDVKPEKSKDNRSLSKALQTT